MKASAIMQIFYGEKGHFETIKQSVEESKLLDKVIEIEEELKKKLSPELLELYKKVSDVIDMLHSESSDNHFLEGFKLGLRVGMEANED